ncbi:reverse transcriptase/maturase family protein [uncultured Secundilactobacillus sp.]|uniref:reverse transcriptase/maturase family protein n=1 Tax=uncultured Secundilactobacillus sp. TaxID=2813935 RepID=UPI00258CC6CE|nr:reverse transcriptase/maturase family protein [uncultured Secundilactobacillus sp.]
MKSSSSMNRRIHKTIVKKYTQFDTQFTENSALSFLRKIASRPLEVQKYRFLPFITYFQKRQKYHARRGKLRASVTVKERPIALAAHHDALIYLFYAEKLSKKYEMFLDNNNLNMVPTAYRRDFHGSNITAAKEIFDFIVDTQKSWIFKGDFKGFFDNLRHRILKEKVEAVLGESLKEDWLSVLNSLTKYRWIKSDNLPKFLKNKEHINSRNGAYVRDRSELGELITDGHIEIEGPNKIGIPQGTALSAVLANVYMIEFDQVMHDICLGYGGLYRRYSDDFVIVIPKKSLQASEVLSFRDFIVQQSQSLTKLKIEPEKTKIFDFDHDCLPIMRLKSSSGTANEKAAWFDYLGFVFNGEVVRLRERGIYRFHYRSKRALHGVMRVKADRRRIALDEDGNKSHTRMVWRAGIRQFEEVSQIPKQVAYRKRMNNEKKRMNTNLIQTRLVTRMYLTGRRYGEKFSMVGYVKRAQSILSENGGRYHVEVVEQIYRQLKKNQRYLHRMRDEN